MTSLRRFALAAGALLCLGTAYSADLGTRGQIWPIDEVDMREIIAREMGKVNWDAVQGLAKASAKHYVENLPATVTTKAFKNQTRYVDPTFTLDDDIQIPRKQPDGSYKMVTYYRKGTTVNPLKTGVRPVRALLFVDTTDEAQMAFTEKLLKQAGVYYAVQDTSGRNVVEASKRLKVPVYYAYAQAVAKFKIDKVPSIVYPGSGAYDAYIAVTELRPPYDPNMALSVWPSASMSTLRK